MAASETCGETSSSSVGRGSLIDAVTTVMSMLPDNPVTDTAEVVITLLRHLAGGVVGAMPGLQAMAPGAESLAALNEAVPLDGHRMLSSNYEPIGGVGDWVTDMAMDAIHGVANDLVVPTDSVFGPAGPDAVAPEHKMEFGKGDGVTHGGFLGRDDVQAQIIEWMK